MDGGFVAPVLAVSRRSTLAPKHPQTPSSPREDISLTLVDSELPSWGVTFTGRTPLIVYVHPVSTGQGCLDAPGSLGSTEGGGAPHTDGEVAG
jgi:hypothetical protein